jgi:ABC-2 type transport system permease protein
VRTVRAELAKLRTLPAAWVLLPLTPVIAVGLAALIALSFRLSYESGPPERTFDPLFATFYSLTLAQLTLIGLGVLAIGSEYGSGTIRASLLATPRRGAFFAAKAGAVAAVTLVVAVLTVPIQFLVVQAGLGAYAVSVTDDGVPTALFGSCAYLVLMALFALGVATMLRRSAVALAVLLPLVFLGSQGLGNVPGIKPVTQWLPDQTGQVIMHLAGPPDDPRFGRPYGPWTGLALLVLWTGAALLGGYLVLRRRDT